MQPLEALIREAGGLSGNEAEASRQLTICNACRYCEGFCAVFPAMTRRLAFDKADVHFLANLCHNCGACLHACQYAPPHEFAVNVPRAMARVRGETYTEYAWPRALGKLYQRNGLTLALATALGLTLFIVLAMAGGTLFEARPTGDFYSVLPHSLMVRLFGVVSAFVLLAMAIGAVRFWRHLDAPPVNGPSLAEATRNALLLTYLDGGHGEGCNEADDRFTLWRRRFHHLTFYGFMLCFASTCVATLYHYGFGLQAPYAVLSIPVVLGTLGGVGLTIGPAGLLWLNLRRHPDHGERSQRPMDRGFIALLLLVAVTGLALLGWRTTRAMPLLLATHLGVVMALFATLPYGKFAHAVYRSAALLKWAIEKRRPSNLRLGGDT